MTTETIIHLSVLAWCISIPLILAGGLGLFFIVSFYAARSFMDQDIGMVNVLDELFK